MNQNTTLPITTMSDLVDWMNINDVNPKTMIALTTSRKTYYGSLQVEKRSTVVGTFVSFSGPMVTKLLIGHDDNTHLADSIVRVVTDPQERRAAISEALDDLVQALPGGNCRENLEPLLLAAGEQMSTLRPTDCSC